MEQRMARMVEDPQGRAFITAMTDQCFRSSDSRRIADQISYLIDQFGVPEFLTGKERIEIHFFRAVGKLFPQMFVPHIRRAIRREVDPVLLPKQSQEQEDFFRQSREHDLRINLNHLGEAILGEGEATKRVETYLRDLAHPHIEYISVKISTLYSQINLIGYEETLDILAERLRLLYRAALAHTFVRRDGTQVSKFVNLDMEEFREFDLTLALFQKVLAEEEFADLKAGIVLQSYLPQSYRVLHALQTWAKERVQKGGAPIKIRLVKGANLAMEAVESSLRGWPQAPFEKKVDTDANFKRLLELACQNEGARAAHIGVASHNLFDIAYALLLRAEEESEPFVNFEMLKGMALPLQRVVKEIAGSLLLYCPELDENHFHNAIAYLVRRLDENCATENFLRHFYELRPNNSIFKMQANLFIAACRKMATLSDSDRRIQDRSLPPKKEEKTASFTNEPDTDFSLSQNRKWAHDIFQEWKVKKEKEIPLVIDGESVLATIKQGFDPSRPQSPSFSYHVADCALAEKAIQAAAHFSPLWSTTRFEDRFGLLGKAAYQFRLHRHTLIGAMIANCGKAIWEADPEVSEAIDFIEYYRRSWREVLACDDVEWRAKGVLLSRPSPGISPVRLPQVGLLRRCARAIVSFLNQLQRRCKSVGMSLKMFWRAGIPKKLYNLSTVTMIRWGVI